MDAIISVATAIITVVKDLYNAGLAEDGQEFEAECYYLQVTFPDGSRLDHNKVWYTAKLEWVEEEGDSFQMYEDYRHEMYAEAFELYKKVESKGKINLAHWSRAQPSYGSEAYIKNADYWEAETERMDRAAA